MGGNGRVEHNVGVSESSRRTRTSVSVSRLGARGLPPPARHRQNRSRGAILLSCRRSSRRRGTHFRTRSAHGNGCNTGMRHNQSLVNACKGAGYHLTRGRLHRSTPENRWVTERPPNICVVISIPAFSSTLRRWTSLPGGLNKRATTCPFPSQFTRS